MSRLERFKNDPPIPMPESTEAVLFLRGVASRAWIALSNFYLLQGAGAYTKKQQSVDYPTVVLAHALEFSSKSTISLCCRQAFDDSKKGRPAMTGKKFTNYSKEVLDEVAEYWAKSSNRELPEAEMALNLLQTVFAACSMTKKELLNSPTTLARQVGLLKRHADAEAAHLSLDEFEFDLNDCAHFVAALALIGTIIHGFDDLQGTTDYFDSIDEAAWAAAKRVFPSIKGRRLFHDFDMAQQSLAYCRMDVQDGAHRLLHQLPYAIGW